MRKRLLAGVLTIGMLFGMTGSVTVVQAMETGPTEVQVTETEQLQETGNDEQKEESLETETTETEESVTEENTELSTESEPEESTEIPVGTETEGGTETPTETETEEDTEVPAETEEEEDTEVPAETETEEDAEEPLETEEDQEKTSDSEIKELEEVTEVTEVTEDVMFFGALPGEDGVTAFVTRMYQVCLDREPDESGLNDWVTRLRTGQSKGSDIAFGFIFSTEFRNMNLCDSCYVNAMYHAFFGREADEAGKADWMFRMSDGQSRGSVMTGFVNSAEFSQLCGRYGIDPGSGDWSNDVIPVLENCSKCGAENTTITDFVARLYRVCLEREPDAVGLADWSTQLANGAQGSHVAYGFIFSEEYKNRHTSNTEFVTMLYRTMMDREPDAAGLADWVDKLDYTNTREFVFNGFLFSPEFKMRCAASGINVGTEIETVDNTEVWRMNITILTLCNEQRIANGVPALKTRQDLWEQVAMVRANECRTLFSHTRPNGTSWTTVYEEAGIDGYWIGENIAYGYRGAEAVVNGWMNSSGHRSNILDSDYTYLAIGYVPEGRYYCQSFLSE